MTTRLGFNQYTLDKAYEGQVANIQDYRHIAGTQEFYINGSETEYIPFGRIVVRDPSDDSKLMLPNAAGQVPIGVAIYNDRFMSQSDNPRMTGIPPLQTMPVLKKGVIYMLAETNIARGANLFFRHSESTIMGEFDAIGRLRADNNNGNAGILPAGTFRITEDVVAGDVAAVFFDFSPVA